MVELSFPRPGTPLSVNNAYRMHWAAKRRELEPWRTAAHWAWKMLPPAEKDKVKDVPCFVELVLGFKDKRRRDPHNYVGTIVKAIIDELVVAGVWPDDTPEWVRVIEPELVVGEMCVVRLVPR